MCGIAGIFSYKNSDAPISLAELNSICESMRSRGPDGEGIWSDSKQTIALCHRRLAIIDLTENASQPMSSVDGSLIITFNGEIYNYKELKGDLLSKGYRFKNNSDTEVLLNLYYEYGTEMVHHLRGMFAFAIWDQREEVLFLARDHFGIKPLYYEDNGSFLRFASQVRSLIAGGGIHLKPCAAGYVGFSIMGSVPEPFTIYENIFSLEAGHCMLYSRSGSKRIWQYYNIANAMANTAPLNLSNDDQVELISAAMRETVEKHLISDVELGVHLSAGIDSNIIANYARNANLGKLNTLSVGFGERAKSNIDELPEAEVFAKIYRSNQISSVYTQSDFFNDMNTVLRDMDQPSVDGLNSWIINATTKSAGLKVALSGVGGDEIFGGYPSFRNIPKALKFHKNYGNDKSLRLLSFFAKILKPYSKYSYILNYGETVEGAYLLQRGVFLPEMLTRELPKNFVETGLEQLDLWKKLRNSISGCPTVHSSITALELSWYLKNQLLRDSDWASMAHGVELRLPFCDIKLFNTLLPILVSERPPTKKILAESLTNDEIRRKLVTRKKTGFGTPVSNWIAKLPGADAKNKKNAWPRYILNRKLRINDLYFTNLGIREHDKESVLVYRIGQLGDTIVSIPSFQEIRKKHPNANLILLTDSHLKSRNYFLSCDLLLPLGFVDRAITYDAGSNALGKIKQYLCLKNIISSIEPVAVYNLVNRNAKLNYLRDGLIFKTINSSIPYYYIKSDKFTTFTDHFTPEWKIVMSAVKDYTCISNPVLNFNLPLYAFEESKSLIPSIGSVSKKLYAVAPGSKMQSKRWAVENYIKVCTYIKQKTPDCLIAIIGGSEDYILGERISSALGDSSVNLCGELSILGTAALLSKCEFFLGNDTGTMHLAALVNTQCYAIFSARDYIDRWYPWGLKDVVFRSNVECSLCMLEKCDIHQNKCLTNISVKEVCDTLDVALNCK